jgi:hypothetical protein
MAVRAAYVATFWSTDKKANHTTYSTTYRTAVWTAY